MRIRSKIFRVAILICCLSTIGCTNIQDMVESFWQLWSLRSKVMEKFHEPNVSVNLSNGRHLTVSLVNSPLKQLSTNEKQEKAREIASFAAKSYKPKDALDSVGVVFAVRKSYFIFGYTDSSDSYRFKTAELPAPEQRTAREATESRADGQNPLGKVQELLDNYRGDTPSLVQAHKILKRILDSDPNNALAYVGMCRVAYKRGYISGDKYESKSLVRAQELLDKALSIDSNLYEAYFYGTYLHLAKKDLETAKEFAEKVQQMEPESARTNLLFSSLALEEKEFDEAIQKAEAVTSQTTERALLNGAYGNLRSAYVRTKQYEQAEAACLKGLQLSPEDPWLWDSYAYVLSLGGNYDKAIEADEKALSLMNFGVARGRLGRTCYKKGAQLLWKEKQYEPSIDYFLKAIEYKPTANAYYGLGIAYWYTSNDKRDITLVKKAEQALAKAVELDPQHKQATKQLKILRERLARYGGR